MPSKAGKQPRLRAVTSNPFATAEQRRATDFADIDDNIVACRARGFGGHAWPRLVPGRRLPGNYNPVLQRDGMVMVTEICAEYNERGKLIGGCGKRRWYLLEEQGIYNPNAKKRYIDPHNWKRIPKDWNYSSRDFDAEAVRRLNEQIMAKARSARSAADAS